MFLKKIFGQIKSISHVEEHYVPALFDCEFECEYEETMRECIRDRTDYFVTYGKIEIICAVNGNEIELKYENLILDKLYTKHDKIRLLYNCMNKKISIV